MSPIKTIPFDKDDFGEIRRYNFGKNWPVVYLIEDGKEIYIGETTSIHNRSKQHYDNPDRRKLKRIHILTDEEYNKSATLDIESLLIQYMAADGKFLLQNGNQGLLNHNYYDKEKYRAKFETIWKELKQIGLVDKELVQIKNSELFKYSPYKALTEDQLEVVSKLLAEVHVGKQKTFIINGKPGTGKTILATYLVKALKESEETKHLEVALVVPMTSLRDTLKKVFRQIKGLNSGMIIGPHEVIDKKYDVLIVDEAHRLRQRKNIANYQSFDITNQHFGFDKEGTELDWIMKASSHQIFFYDKDQSVRPSDVPGSKFIELNATEHELKTQLRIGDGTSKDGDEYITFIQDIFDLSKTTWDQSSSYDFKIYNDINLMVKDIKLKDSEFDLCRMVSGYAWPWISKDDPTQHDIEIEGIKLFWNSVNKNWVNSPNAINEVGCIHTVQGYDLNYAGVIIGPELSYDNNLKKFVIHTDKYMDVNGKRSIENPEELERYIINIYKTLLTRGIKGTYVYIVDPALREYFANTVNKSGSSIISPYIGEMINIPLFDSVGCGELMYADQNIQEMVPVRSDLISKGSKYFVLRTSGDSMNKSGINNGDLVLCRKDYHPEVGNTVVALIGDDATIKILDRKEGKVILKPNSTNQTHEPMIFSSNDEIKVQGVVIKVLEQ